MTTSSAVTLFRALDTDNSGTLSATEVTPAWSCSSSKAPAPVADLVGLNQDQFIAAIAQKKIPQTTIDTVARLINEGSATAPSDLVGGRVGNFFSGIGLFIVAVALAPFEAIGNIVLALNGSTEPSVAWALFPASFECFSEAFEKSHKYNAEEVTNATTSFLQLPSIGNDPSCVSDL